MIVSFTGHRPKDLPNNKPWVVQKIRTFLEDVGCTYVVQGLAAGIDMTAAEIAIKDGYGLISVKPYTTHENFAPHLKERYANIITHSAEVVVAAEGDYAVWKLHNRNRYMVDHSHILCAIWGGKQSGGTYACLKYALAKSTNPIYVIDPLAETTAWLREPSEQTLSV